MNRVPNVVVRSALKIQVRHFRIRTKFPSSHIPQLKDSINDSKELKLQASSADQVVNDLKKLGFKGIADESSMEKTLLEYLDSTKSSFNKSSKNLNALKASFAKDHEGPKRRMELLFDYILKEAEGEIKRLEKMGPNKIRDLHRQKKVDISNSRRQGLNSEKELEQAIFKDIIALSAPEDDDSLLRNTEIMFHILSDLNMRNVASEEVISLEQMVQAFELSKIVPIPEYRIRGLLLSGYLLYSSKRVRMDPINESFYVDSLVYFGFYDKALELFHSNLQNVNQRWWNEMGMMICLRANRIRQFDKLWDQAEKQFGNNYTNIKVLRTGIKKKLLLRDFEAANKLTKKFLDITEKYGWKPSQLKENDSRLNTLFADEFEAENFLNEIELPTDLDFVSIIHSHLYRGNKKQAMQLMAKFVELNGIQGESYHVLFLRLKLYLIQEFEVIEKEVSPYLSQENAEQKLNELRKTFQDMTTEMNLHTVKKSCNQLFFDNVLSLSSNSSFTRGIEEFIVNFWMLPSNQNKMSETKLGPSKKFRGLLEILLKSGKEETALEILTKMEDSATKLQDGLNENVTPFFVEANAHHYALFIEYYKEKSKNAKTKSRQDFNNRVFKIVQRMNDKSIRYNGVFLTSLLTYYRETTDFNNCFQIINPLLSLKAANEDVKEPFNNLLSFFDRRDITRPLYIEMWKTYEKYYRFFGKSLAYVDKKSNHAAWSHYVTKTRLETSVHPHWNLRQLFKTMIRDDNILPDSHFYYIIIYTLIRSRDWNFVPAVLKFMSDVHGLPLTDKLQMYILMGLKKDYITEEKIRLTKELGNQKFGANQSAWINAKKSIESKRREGLILQKGETVDQMIQNIVEFTKSRNNGDVSEIKEAFQFLGIDETIL